jgi:hypothetical protein
MLKLAHLTREQHIEIARLLNQAEDNLDAASRIVARAPFSDRVLYASRTIQERLIDPLSEAWKEKKFGVQGCPYQSIAYGRGVR